MCAVSMIGDHYNDLWKPKPWYPTPAVPMPDRETIIISQPPTITRDEFDELKRQVIEMKELLKRAKKYDEDNGEPECEIDAKMDVLRKVAEMVGIDLDDVIARKAAT